MHYGVNSQIAFVGKFVLAINIFGCKLFIEKGKSDFILATNIFKFVKKTLLILKRTPSLANHWFILLMFQYVPGSLLPGSVA